MKKKTIILLKILCAAGLFAAGGCEDRTPKGASPVERNRLLIRLFASMDKNDPASAAAQAAKVRALDPGNAYFAWIIEQQECNQAILAAQKALNADQPEKAEEVLTAARKRHPMNHALAEDLQKVRDMIALRRAIREFRAAKSPAERESSLRIISQLAEKMRDPALAADAAAQWKRLSAAAPGRPEAREQKPR